MTSLCVVRDCWREPAQPIRRRPAEIGRLCAPCHRRLETVLAQLPRLYTACESALADRPPPMADRVSGSRAARLPVNPKAVEARSDVKHLLASWSRLVVDERGVGGPPDSAVRGLVAYLLRHLAWLSAHPAVGDLVEELTAVAGRARLAAYPDPVVKLDLGRCVHAGCDRTIFASLHADDAAVPGHLRCEAGHAWPPHRWALLARRLRDARNEHGSAPVARTGTGPA